MCGFVQRGLLILGVLTLVVAVKLFDHWAVVLTSSDRCFAKKKATRQIEGFLGGVVQALLSHLVFDDPAAYRMYLAHPHSTVGVIPASHSSGVGSCASHFVTPGVRAVVCC